MLRDEGVRDTVRAANQEAREEAAALSDKIRDARAELRETLSADEVDEAAAMKLAERIGELEAERVKTRVRGQIEAAKELGPERPRMLARGMGRGAAGGAGFGRGAVARPRFGRGAAGGRAGLGRSPLLAERLGRRGGYGLRAGQGRRGPGPFAQRPRLEARARGGRGAWGGFGTGVCPYGLQSPRRGRGWAPELGARGMRDARSGGGVRLRLRDPEAHRDVPPVRDLAPRRGEGRRDPAVRPDRGLNAPRGRRFAPDRPVDRDRPALRRDTDRPQRDGDRDRPAPERDTERDEQPRKRVEG
jgi:hypothetical protein